MQRFKTDTKPFSVQIDRSNGTLSHIKEMNKVNLNILNSKQHFDKP